MLTNFTIQDLLGSILAFVFFPFVSVAPGYTLSWALNLFEFKKRTQLAQYLIGLVLSNAILPIFSFLSLRYLPRYFIYATLLSCLVFFTFTEAKKLTHNWAVRHLFVLGRMHRYKKIALLLAGSWIVFSLLLLVDLQVGRKLYFPNVAYDYTTRDAIINAITHTGVPPVNPTYYPGHAEQLTFLYYYWYIPVSTVDQIGGPLVNARHALIAGVIWTGLCLMATIALYLRLRNHKTTGHPWSMPLIGIQLLLISGLDFIPVLAIALRARQVLGQMIFDGRIEGWNMPIMSWLNALTWVPNHVSAALQCIAAMLIMLSVFPGNNKQRLIAALMAGVAFASALGTSVWVTLLFAIAWAVWSLALLLSKKHRRLFWFMALAGLTGAGLSIPFIKDLLQPGANTGASLPVALYVRPFVISAFLTPIPVKLSAVLNLLFLPLNYLMELGLFFILGLYWIQNHKTLHDQTRPFVLAEAILLTTVTIILSFVYSTVIQINDLGIRGWLLGQFVLLIWASQVIQSWLETQPPSRHSIFGVLGNQTKIGRALQVLFIIGVLTTSLEAFSTRMWPMLVDWNIAGFPNDLSPDTNLGSRTYYARFAYEFINKNLPTRTIIQNNPTILLDRPSGLYGDRQMVISDRTAYGVPKDTYQALKNGIAMIFNYDTAWSQIDSSCIQYHIDVIAVNDLDPLWKHLSALEQERRPLYQNAYYAVFACGKTQH